MSQTESSLGLTGPPAKSSVAPIGTFDYPSLAELEHGLKAAMNGNDCPTDQELTIVGRRQNVYASSHPSEVLECRYADGQGIEILCKYSACINHHHLRHAHRGGAPHEAAAYKLLQTLDKSVPTFFGVYGDTSRENLWIFVEFLGDALRLSKVSGDRTRKSAEWIADLHGDCAALAPELQKKGLNLYDESYYQGWIERTIEFSQAFSGEFPWLRPLGKAASRALGDLAGGPRTMIHGEYYPHNILVQERRIAPVDWESTALAPGEIDLAALTDGEWGAELVAACEEAYAQVRWPGGAPEDFRRRLDLSRLYLNFRWLGERPERTRKDSRRFEHLHALGRELGLI